MTKRRLVSFDWAMKKLLRSKANFEILEGFLGELLKDDIKILEVLEGESNKNSGGDKYNRVDLKVRNDRGEIVVIEVQYDRELDYFQRILYGASKAVTEHIAEGDPFSKVVKVISVSIVWFDLGHGEDYVYHGSTIFRGIHRNDILRLDPNQKKIFSREAVENLFPEYYIIKINNFDEVARDSFDEWVYFLKTGEIKDKFKARGLKKAKEALDVLRLPEDEMAAYEKYAEDLHYQASMFLSTFGLGKIEGLAEGEELGIEKGKMEEKLDAARKMLAHGLAPDMIVAITGLPATALRNLAEGHPKPVSPGPKPQSRRPKT